MPERLYTRCSLATPGTRLHEKIASLWVRDGREDVGLFCGWYEHVRISGQPAKTQHVPFGWRGGMPVSVPDFSCAAQRRLHAQGTLDNPGVLRTRFECKRDTLVITHHAFGGDLDVSGGHRSVSRSRTGVCVCHAAVTKTLREEYRIFTVSYICEYYILHMLRCGYVTAVVRRSLGYTETYAPCNVQNPGHNGSFAALVRAEPAFAV